MPAVCESPQYLSACGGSCPSMAVAHEWVLVDQVVAARCTNGQQVIANLTGGTMKERDGEGRIAHVLGIRVKGTYTFTTTDITNDAITGYAMAGLLNAFFLTDESGHNYLAGDCDGRNLRDDIFFRHWRNDLSYDLPAGLSKDVGAKQANNIDIEVYIPFTRIDHFGPQIEGCIPFGSLIRNSGAFKFTVATALPSGAATNVTLTGFSSGLEIWLDVVYLPGLVISEPWQLSTYTVTSQGGPLQWPDRAHEYCALRYTPEDTDGQNCDTLGNLIVNFNGAITVPALTAAQVLTRDGSCVASDLDARITDLPLVAPTGEEQAQMLIPRQRLRDQYGSGPVNFQYASQGSQTLERFLHRTVQCQSLPRANMFAKTAAISESECSCKGVVGSGVVDVGPNRSLVLLPGSQVKAP